MHFAQVTAMRENDFYSEEFPQHPEYSAIPEHSALPEGILCDVQGRERFPGAPAGR